MDLGAIEHIRAILEGDRTWSGYAIADLDPEHHQYADWIVGLDSRPIADITKARERSCIPEILEQMER
jgi:hypothetical protein